VNKKRKFKKYQHKKALTDLRAFFNEAFSVSIIDEGKSMKDKRRKGKVVCGAPGRI
jgi:hypothetical protein